MSKLKEKELLSVLEVAFRQLLKDINWKETRVKYEQAREQIKKMIHHQGIDNDWLPTPENINALPEPVRKYIHDLRTNVDPAGIVRENILIKDTCRALVIKLEEKLTVTEKWLVDFLRQMPIYDAQPRKDYALRKFKEQGIRVLKE